MKLEPKTIVVTLLTLFVIFFVVQTTDGISKARLYETRQEIRNENVQRAINSLHKTDSDQCDWVTITDKQFETAFGGKPVSITTGETPKRIHFYSCKNY